MLLCIMSYYDLRYNIREVLYYSVIKNLQLKMAPVLQFPMHMKRQTREITGKCGKVALLLHIDYVTFYHNVISFLLVKRDILMQMTCT